MKKRVKSHERRLQDCYVGATLTFLMERKKAAAAAAVFVSNEKAGSVDPSTVLHRREEKKKIEKKDKQWKEMGDRQGEGTGQCLLRLSLSRAACLVLSGVTLSVGPTNLAKLRTLMDRNLDNGKVKLS